MVAEVVGVRNIRVSSDKKTTALPKTGSSFSGLVSFGLALLFVGLSIFAVKKLLQNRVI